MEALFSNNLFAIYIIACIAVISYTDFKENQRMFLLYLFTYALAFFRVFRISVCLLLLFLITFIFIEYLTDDSKKLALVTQLHYKVLDYTFMMLSQYHFLWIFLAFVFLFLSHVSPILIHNQHWIDCIAYIIKYISVIPVFWGLHLTISQPFKIKSISSICQIFDQYPPYQFKYVDKMQEKFDLLCAFEDKTYFMREKSYSCFSWEYIRLFIKRRVFNNLKLYKSKPLKALKYAKENLLPSTILSRGYSTPEMQLLRTLGVLRGYEEYKYQRKAFEILYSKIIFASLKKYHQSNTYSPLEHYRHYLLHIYLQTVMTKINDRRCAPLSTAFSDPDNIANWSMNGLFVACLGLSFRKVSDYNLALYQDIIDRFDLDQDRIRVLSAKFPEKFPSEN